jgi:hypothetical protein
VFGNCLFEESHDRQKSLAGRKVFWKAREENFSALNYLSECNGATVVGCFLVSFDHPKKYRKS